MVAYLLLIHETSDQIRILVERLLSDSRSRVYIHLDAKAFLAPWLSAAQNSGSIIMVERDLVNWGGYSQYLAMNRLVVTALDNDAVQTFVLLSGSCFPVKPMNVINDLLSRRGGYDAMALWGVISDPIARIKVKGTDSVEKLHFPDLAWANPARGKIRRIFWRLYRKLNSLLPYRRLHNRPVVKGSSWIAVGRDAACEIVKFDATIKSFFQRTMSPDETVMQTNYYHYLKERNLPINFTEESANRQGLHYIGYAQPVSLSIINRLKRKTDIRRIDVDHIDVLLNSDALFSRKCSLNLVLLLERIVHLTPPSKCSKNSVSN